MKRPRRKRPGQFSWLLMTLPVAYLAATTLIGGHSIYMTGVPA